MIKGVSYFGVRSPKHVLADMQDIKAAGFNAVLHTWSEEEWYSTLEQVLLKSGSPQWANNA